MREREAIRKPLANSLIGMFNDIKSKSTKIFLFQSTLWHAGNPHKTVDTLKSEQWHIMQSIIADFQGLQEQLVGILQTLNPDDPHGDRTSKALEFGLNDQEKKLRATQMSQWIDQIAAAAQQPQAQKPQKLQPQKQTDASNKSQESAQEMGNSSKDKT